MKQLLACGLLHGARHRAGHFGPDPARNDEGPIEPNHLALVTAGDAEIDCLRQRRFHF